MKLHPPRRGREAAFSLVEIVLALGIISFAFVALLGLMPIGLRSFEGAIDATVQSQIAQAVTTQARQSKFSELEKLNKNPDADEANPAADYYFDAEGRELVQADAETAIEMVYSAAVLLVQTTEGVSTRLPTGSTSTIANPHLATLKVVVKKVSAPREARTFSLYIANNGL
jgi:uncharacterized protein (TIGR02598 family)